MTSTPTGISKAMNHPQRRGLWVCIALCAVLALSACSDELPYYTRADPVRSYSHDPDAFTQCLVFDDGALYESTGLYGESSLRRVDLEGGEVLQMRRLPDQLFGEGCAVWEDTILQLTWKAGMGFVYDKESFTVERRFSYAGEGWGLTHDGSNLIMSDGTSYLRFLDPITLQETSRVQVVDKGEPVEQLNELEWIDGQVWANVWRTSDIVRIDAQSGEVLGWIDCSALTEQQPRGVLNGIAERDGRIYFTGKRWTSIYEVEIKPADPPDSSP